LLPIALLLVLSRLQPQVMRLLVDTRTGWAVLGSIALLEGSGLLLLERMARVEV